MCDVKPRNFALNLKLEVGKVKRPVVKKEEPEDSFYDTNLDDEKCLDSAVDFFSLPTPDIMKKFPGTPLSLRTTAPNTPTVEERQFEQTSLSLMPDVNLEDNLDFLRTPQPNAMTGSLQTPIVDPNYNRNPLIGHLTGLAPPVSHETVNCVQQQPSVNPRTSSTTSAFTTHAIVSPSYNYTDESSSGALSSSTSSFVAPSTSQQYSDSYSSASFHELRTRTDNVQQEQRHQQSADSLPTVIPDHVYYSPSASVGSPGSVLSHDSTSSDTYSRVSPNSGTKRKHSQDSSAPKKQRMTKKQQFVELQNREKFLIENNAELRRRVQGMDEGCKKLKKLLMQKLQSAP